MHEEYVKSYQKHFLSLLLCSWS